MGRKSPIKHGVKESRRARPYVRGEGQRTENPHGPKFTPAPSSNSFGEKLSRQQILNGLASGYDTMGCQGVANEIKQGRKVTENAEFGFRTCVHQALGPRYNIQTRKIIPQSKGSKDLEMQLFRKTNELLKTGGYRQMNPRIFVKLAKQDKKFEEDVLRKGGINA